MEINKPYYLKNPSRSVYNYNMELQYLWEFSLPDKDKIEWAVTLTCLIDDILYTQLELLISNNIKENNPMENAKNDFNECNPFINKYSFFEKKSIQTVVLILKNILNQQGEQRELDKVLNTLGLLKCNAFIFTESESEVCAYPDKPYKSSSILLREGSERGEIKNCFMLPEKYCQDWKKNALFYSLSKMKVSKDVFEDIWKIACAERNFLISVIKSGHREVIKYMRDSFTMVRKISDLKFDVDPKIPDNNGTSPFYYGLQTEDYSLCIQLYHLAIFFTIDEENEEKEIENIENLYDVIGRDYEILSEDQGHVRKSYEISTSLSTLIEIRLEIKRKVLNHKASFDRRIENNDAKLQRDIMLHILSYYLKIIKETGKDIDVPDLDYYIYYKYFFDELDVDVSLFFFYNIYMLKSKLKLENENSYADIESAFFISVLNYVIFNRKVKISDYFSELSKICAQCSHSIFYNVRNAVLSKVKLFFDVLQNTTVDDSSTRQEVPSKELYLLLYSYPEIKDHFLVRRLTYYIESALNTIETSANLKRAFPIQRVLQVLGEFIELEPKDDSCVKWFLSVYIPKSIRKVLSNLRNELTHLGEEAFGRKIEMEKNIHLFQDMEKDIRKIYIYLQPLLRVLRQKTIIYSKRKLEESLENTNSSEEYKANFRDRIAEIVENLFDASNDTSKFSNDDLIFVMNTVLENLDAELKDRESSLSENKNGAALIEKLLSPLLFLRELLVDSHILNGEELKQLIEESNDYSRKEVGDSINAAKQLIVKVKSSLSGQTPEYIKPRLGDISATEKFLSSLKFQFDIPKVDRTTVIGYFQKSTEKDSNRRKKIRDSVKEGFSMNANELSKCKISFLQDDEWKTLVEYYKNKKEKQKIFETLIKIDPRKKLIEKLKNNIYLTENDFKKLCELTVDLSKDLSVSFRETCENYRKRNRLSHLFNRISEMHEILRQELIKNVQGDIRSLTPTCCKNNIYNDKNEIRCIEDELLLRYVEDDYLHLSIEMLVFDCMNLFDKKHSSLFRKTSKIYEGVNLRNEIAHQDVLIRTLCEWFDPSDLPSNVMQIVCKFLKDKDMIERILVLHKNEENFQNLINLMGSFEKEETEDIQDLKRDSIEKEEKLDVEKIKLLLQCTDIDHIKDIEIYIELLSWKTDSS